MIKGVIFIQSISNQNNLVAFKMFRSAKSLTSGILLDEFMSIKVQALKSVGLLARDRSPAL